MSVAPKTVRKEMLARDLKGVIDLPDFADNQRVKIIVEPEEERKKILTTEEINAILNRMTGCLTGLDKSKTPDDWRAERLAQRYGIERHS